MPCFSECPSVLFIIQRGQCHIIRFISYDEPEEEGKSFFDVRVSPLFFSRPAVHCNALLCFRVRHEIQSLRTWGGGRDEGGSWEARRKGSSAALEGERARERGSTHICCRPRKNVDDYDGGNRQPAMQLLQCNAMAAWARLQSFPSHRSCDFVMLCFGSSPALLG